jgi:hypothetical protein
MMVASSFVGRVWLLLGSNKYLVGVKHGCIAIWIDNMLWHINEILIVFLLEKSLNFFVK